MDAELLQQLDPAIVTAWAERLKKVIATRDEVHDGGGLLALEQAVFSAVVELADEVTAALLRQLLAEREARARQDGERPPAGLRCLGRRETEVRLLGGRTERLKTPYWAPDRLGRHRRRRGVGRRGPSGVGVYPQLEALGIRGGATPALRAEVARQVAESTSLEVAQSNLSARGIRLNIKTTRRLAYGFGGDALACRDAWRAGRLPPGPEDARLLAGKRVVVCKDGGRYRQRVRPRQGRRRKHSRRHGYGTPWREPKLFVIYVVDERGRRLADVPPLCEATTGDADALYALLLDYLKRYGGADAAELIFVADGALWIWDRVARLVEELGIDPARVREVLDFCHGVEHLARAAELRVGWTQQQRRRWLRQQRVHLKAGRVERVIDAIDELCLGRRAKKLATERDYFVTNVNRVRYAQFRRERVPTGSGAVESAIRRVINLRLKGPGIFWLEENAEIVMHMRAYLKVGRWTQLVRETVAYAGSARLL